LRECIYTKMAVVKQHGSVKRFGARYGTKTKYRFGKIESEQRKLHKCLYCNKVKVKRVAMGIWQCRACDSKFVGKAYSVQKKIEFAEESAEEMPKAQEEITETKEEVQEEAESTE